MSLQAVNQTTGETSQIAGLFNPGSGGETYTAGDGINISAQNEISTKMVMFPGTRAEWDELSLAEKVKYTHTCFDDDEQTGVVDSVPTIGSLHLITSGGVAAALDDKAGKNQISNSNIFDNPWFTINQRGVTNGWTAQYSVGVDRWRKSSASDSTLEITDDGVAEINDNAFSIYQVLDDNSTNYESIKQLYGKRLTFSALFSDGTVESGSFDLPVSDYRPSSDIPRTFISDSEKLTFARIESYAAGNVNFAISVKAGNTIRAVKLEVGSVSTLGMDTAPNYQQELAKCQRYFVRHVSKGITPIALGFGINTGNIWVLFPLPVPMRTNPTLTYSDINCWRYSASDSSGMVIPSAISAHSASQNILRVLISSTNAITVGQTYIIYDANSSGYVDFSADL